MKKFIIVSISIYIFASVFPACSNDKSSKKSSAVPDPAIPKKWGTAELLETDNAGNAAYPQLAVDPEGNVIAVWYQGDGTWTNIRANRYVPGTGWGMPELIETGDAGNALYPQVAMDPNGNAVAAWQQDDGTNINIYANRYIAGNGWGTMELIENDGMGQLRFPQVAVDSGGNAVVVWQQDVVVRDNIEANRYTAGTGWGAIIPIENENAGSAAFPQVAVDPDGNAIAVWYQDDGTRYNIYSNRYIPGTGWGTMELIETNNAGSAGRPQVAVDPGGNAVAVWQQNDGTRYNIWANRYVPGTGWGTAELIESENADDAEFPQVALDPGGNAVAVWQQSDGARTNIRANRYVPGTGWGTAELIETDDAGDAIEPQVALDQDGNAVTVWSQSDGIRYNITANSYIAGTGWGTAELIETYNSGSAYNVQIVMDPLGNGTAVWSQHDGTRYNIMANRFE